MVNDIENVNNQVDNVTPKKIQLFEIEYNGKEYAFDISSVIESLKPNETSRSLRNYKVQTEEFINFPLNDFKSVKMVCDHYISSLFQYPIQYVEIKSKTIENLSCITYYDFDTKEWQIRLKYQDQNIPHPLPIISSKNPLYKEDNSRNDKLTKQLLNSEITKDIVKSKGEAEKIIYEIFSASCQNESNINDLKELTLIEHDIDDRTEAEKEADEKNKIKASYGDVAYNKALELIRTGQAQKFIVEKHKSTYAGISDRISWSLSCVFASTHIESSIGGVHMKIGGPSGNGKNTLVTNFTNLTPPTIWRLTTPSAKSMFYNTDIHSDMVVIIDEFNNNNTDLITTLKLSTSRFQDKTLLDTVAFFEAKTLEIPERIAFVILSVEPLANEELNQRCLTVDVPGGEDYLRNINKKQKQREQNLPTKNRQPDFDTQVCRCIYSILNLRTYDIRIPFAPVIEWRDIQRTRNWELFTDLIKCSAYYNILNREYFQNPNDPSIGVYLAKYEDYINALDVYNKLSDNNVTKLSDKELKIINALIDNRKQEIGTLIDHSNEANVENLTPNDSPGLELSDVIAFGTMYFKDIAKIVGIPDKQVEYTILGKNSDGLVARVFGLHCEKIAIQGIKQTYHKWRVWYDGPDQIVSNIASVQREICDMETQNCKQQWLKEWQTEDSKWNPSKKEYVW